MVVKNTLITDEMVAANAHLIGYNPDRTHQRWNAVANADSIRQWAWGIGDDNPLWLDREYADQSALGGLTAPPAFLFSVDSGAVFPGFEGLARILVSTGLQWHARIKDGDTFTSEATYLGADDVVGRKAGRMILQHGETRYWNQHGDHVATKQNCSARIERRAAGGKLNYPPRLHQYDAEELFAIRDQAIAEELRGGEVRYWDDVQVGDAVGPVVKGPFSLTDLICWYCGNGPHGRRPHRMFWKEVASNPDFYYRKNDTGGVEFSERGHYDPEMAHEIGMPGPYDNGSQRPCWITHLLTDWMGDAGFLSSMASRMHLPNVFGDTTWLRGTVTGKSEVDQEHGAVQIEVEGTNQLGELTTTATGEVLLLRKGATARAVLA